jgi:hypothetical protein
MKIFLLVLTLGLLTFGCRPTLSDKHQFPSADYETAELTGRVTIEGSAAPLTSAIVKLWFGNMPAGRCVTSPTGECRISSLNTLPNYKLWIFTKDTTDGDFATFALRSGKNELNVKVTDAGKDLRIMVEDVNNRS